MANQDSFDDFEDICLLLDHNSAEKGRRRFLGRFEDCVSFSFLGQSSLHSPLPFFTPFLAVCLQIFRYASSNRQDEAPASTSSFLVRTVRTLPDGRETFFTPCLPQRGVLFVLSFLSFLFSFYFSQIGRTKTPAFLLSRTYVPYGRT